MPSVLKGHWRRCQRCWRKASVKIDSQELCWEHYNEALKEDER